MSEICGGIYNIANSMFGKPIKKLQKLSTPISFVAAALYFVTLVIAWLNFSDYDDSEIKDSFILTRCLNAIVSAFAVFGFLIYFAEFMIKLNAKKPPPALEMVRSFVSSGTLVLVSLLLGEYTEDTERFMEFLCVFIALILFRILDLGLDDLEKTSVYKRTDMNVGEEMEKYVRLLKRIVVIVSFIIVISLIGNYMEKKTLFDNDPANHNDGLLITVLFLVSFHLLLIFIETAWGFCYTDELQTINRIPLISKAVFITNLVCLSSTIGERMAVDQRVVELVFALVVLGMAESVARNEM
jgi:hypothetical protein